MADMKNDPSKNANQSGSSQNKGSGSDTVSAAKISAGTSVGNVGEMPKPHAQSGSSSGAGSQGGGASSQGSSAQNPTLASHTSKPMGGSVTGSGQSANAASSGQGQGGANQHGASSQGQGKGGSDTAKQGGGQSSGQSSGMAGETLDQATEWARDTYERASSWASDALEHGSDQFDQVRRRAPRSFGSVQSYVSQNPVMVGLVGLAAGLILGALLPRTRREDEVFGEWADEVRQQGLRYAHEMTQRGRDYVEQSFVGDDPQFSKHESEFGGGQGANRH